MSFRDVTQNERTEVPDLVNEAGIIQQRASTLLGGLIRAFGSNAPGAHLKLSLKDLIHPATMSITTPMSEGRTRLQFEKQNGSLVGRLLIERAEVDTQGKKIWTVVWGFYLGNSKSVIYIDKPGDMKGYGFESQFQSEREDAFVELGASLIFALQAGPIV